MRHDPCYMYYKQYTSFLHSLFLRTESWFLLLETPLLHSHKSSVSDIVVFVPSWLKGQICSLCIVFHLFVPIVSFWFVMQDKVRRDEFRNSGWNYYRRKTEQWGYKPGGVERTGSKEGLSKKLTLENQNKIEVKK